MERLWSPWRAKYIDSFKEQKEHDDECFFCTAVSDSEHAREHLVLHSSKHAIVMMNKFPYNNGHLLVAPKIHTNDLLSLPDEVFADVSSLTRKCVSVLKEVYSPQGFNIGANLGRAAGAGVPSHLHYHVLPRWNGDTNFLLVISEVKVISEDINETYEKLFVHCSRW
ncbi:MAG: HIT domain-containing protein [Candidatus Kapabacteria bacterium]|nr:HIT domain-containing protein [Candidatus Kapabacteria bacterium]